MSLGIGLQTETGIVLVADSMVLRAIPGSAGVTAVIGGRKLHWLSGQRGALVLSMAYDPARGSLAEQLDLAEGPVDEATDGLDFEQRLQDLYAKARLLDRGANQVVSPLTADPGESPQLLSAGGPVGSPPQLIRITPQGKEVGRPGSVFAVGGWLYTAPQRILDQLKAPAPADPYSAVTVALSWIRSYISDRYGPEVLTGGVRAFIEQRGMAPHVAPPYDVAVFTANNVMQREVAC